MARNSSSGIAPEPESPSVPPHGPQDWISDTTGPARASAASAATATVHTRCRRARSWAYAARRRETRCAQVRQREPAGQEHPCDSSTRQQPHLSQLAPLCFQCAHHLAQWTLCQASTTLPPPVHGLPQLLQLSLQELVFRRQSLVSLRQLSRRLRLLPHASAALAQLLKLLRKPQRPLPPMTRLCLCYSPPRRLLGSLEAQLLHPPLLGMPPKRKQQRSHSRKATRGRARAARHTVSPLLCLFHYVLSSRAI